MSLPIEVIAPATPAPSSWRDWAGVVASVACAVHCAAMPFVVAYLPSLGLSFLADEAFHKWMFVICMGIGMAAFVPGWRLHRRLMPFGIAGAGLAMIGFAAFGMAGECCAACEEGSNAAAVAAAAAAEEEGEQVAACCENGCCEHEVAVDSGSDGSGKSAAVTDSTEASDETPADAPESFLSSELAAQYGVWLTPIGGILLVGAHLLNRRFGCHCGCCETPSSRS